MKRSKHSLSHYRLLTANLGELVPCGLVEVTAGDTIQHSTSLLIRTTPLLSPVMHPVHVRVHHFFIPFRLVWDDWENFITGGSDGLNASTFPTITPNTGSGYAVGSLADYLTVPTGVDDLPHSALPFRCYAAVWNEIYRDRLLQNALTIDTTDGADTTTNVTLQNVDWEKDYFTTARTSPQLGAAVSLPLGSSALVKMNSTDTISGVQNALRFLDVTGAVPLSNRAIGIGVGGSDHNVWATGTTTAVANQPLYPSNLYADLSTATAATINQLREAWAVQKFEENRMRYGSRYVEMLKMWGITASDQRLQRPEYLSGGKQTITFSEVLQQSPTTSGTPNTGVGAMLGHGIGAVRTNRYRRFFEEHGYVLSLMSVVPKTMYVNGLQKTHSRTTKTDFFQPELAHIGMQPILNKEVYWAHTTPNGTFGYNDRDDTYRRQESYVSGDFRSATANYWHMGRVFASDPALNASFVSADPTTRIFQSAAADTLYVMAMHSIQARRKVPSVGTPGGF